MSSKAMSERELEEIEDSIFSYKVRLLQEVRRSHTEADELRERVEELEEPLRPFAQFAPMHFKGLDQKVAITVWTAWLAEAESALSPKAKLETRSGEEELNARIYVRSRGKPVPYVEEAQQESQEGE